MSSDSPKNLSQQLTELDTLLAWFDKPDVDLEEALEKFKIGLALTEDIKKQLAKVENKITILKERFDQKAV